MVPVVLAERCEFLQPFVDIRQQAVLGVVHPHPGRNVHGGHQYHSLPNCALAQRAFHLRRDIEKFSVPFRLECEIFRVGPHTPMIQPALREGTGRTVLLVDDDKPLIKMMSLYLVRLGYEVHAAESADVAWAAVQSAADLAAALLDASIDGLQMEDLAGNLLAANPRMCVIV